MKYIKTFEKQKGQSFIDWLLKNYPDKNEWKNIDNIDCSYEGLTEFDGIENLINLYYLDCSGNKLTKLNLDNLDNLEILWCVNNQLPYQNLDEYKKWFEKTYPEKVAAKRYNL